MYLNASAINDLHFPQFMQPVWLALSVMPLPSLYAERSRKTRVFVLDYI